MVLQRVPSTVVTVVRSWLLRIIDELSKLCRERGIEDLIFIQESMERTS